MSGTKDCRRPQIHSEILFFSYNPPNLFRVRVGSSYINSGGVLLNVNSLRYHPNFSDSSSRYDVGLVRTSSNINQNNNVRPAAIAGSNYNLGNNQAVWATGWRHTSVSRLFATSKLSNHTLFSKKIYCCVFT